MIEALKLALRVEGEMALYAEVGIPGFRNQCVL